MEHEVRIKELEMQLKELKIQLEVERDAKNQAITELSTVTNKERKAEIRRFKKSLEKMVEISGGKLQEAKIMLSDSIKLDDDAQASIGRAISTLRDWIYELEELKNEVELTQ